MKYRFETNRDDSVLPFTIEELQEAFRQGMACIGEGSRRKCFQVPNVPFCVKFYRLPSEYTKKTRIGVKLEILLFRHCRFFNTSCQEWRYYRNLKKRLPPHLFAVFPDTVERIRLPDRGWGLAENLLVNADGSPMRRVKAEIRVTEDPVLQQTLYRALADLCAELERHAVKFYDPPNIMVQWQPDGTFRLRIVDFEPGGRTYLPLITSLPFYIRRKVHRRSARYLAALAAFLPSDVTGSD